MTVAIRPPEYFPRPEYLALFFAADLFVIADTFAYSRQSFQNRARVRTAQPPGSGWMWLTIPLEAGAVGSPIRDVTIAPSTRWRSTHLKTIRHHLGSSAFFPHFEPDIERLLRQPGDRLTAVTVASVEWSAAALQAPARVVRAADVPGENTSVPGLIDALGATELVTLPESGDRDSRLAADAGVGCRAHGFREARRRQNFPGFVPECCGLDLLLNHGPDAAAYLYSSSEPR